MPKKSKENIAKTVMPRIDQILPDVLDVYDPDTETLVKSTPEDLKKTFYKKNNEKAPINLVYKVVYPDEFNLKPSGRQKTKTKVGRPKKIKKPLSPPLELPASHQVSKTRSGREVKFPKYIQNDFKKILIDKSTSADPNETEVQLSDFVSHTEKSDKNPSTNEVIPPVQVESFQKKRKIPAQYRCPKCKKAYLGRTKILEHLKKNPSHGPMHQNEDKHFEVWNYLVSITQKCPSSERGPKFCQELSNLLHNLVLLTNALFKKLGSAANEVEVDKVLGNAIGLSPGTYYFDDNNLYKDVTVLQLMGNGDFLSSIRAKSEENLTKPQVKNCLCDKLSLMDELMLRSMLVSSETEAIAKKINDIKINSVKPDTEPLVKEGPNAETKRHFTGEEFLVSPTPNYEQLSDYDMKSDVVHTNHFELSPHPPDPPPKIKIHANILLCPPNPKYVQQDNYSECNREEDNAKTDIQADISPELLIENSVLSPISNLPHSVDELMLPVSSEPTNILENSSSSDEVMNVDQFVNERFRRITESDLEGHSSSSLNLDLPSLDLFQFHTS